MHNKWLCGRTATASTHTASYFEARASETEWGFGAKADSLWEQPIFARCPSIPFNISMVDLASFRRWVVVWSALRWNSNHVYALLFMFFSMSWLYISNNMCVMIATICILSGILAFCGSLVRYVIVLKSIWYGTLLEGNFCTFCLGKSKIGTLSRQLSTLALF